MIQVRSTVLAQGSVRLEPLGLQHADGLRAAASDGELWTLRITSVPEPHKVERYIEEALRMADRLAFAVIETNANRVIGSTSYHDIVTEIDRVEIGWTWYAKSWQRTHVNTTCKLMLLTHAFEQLGCAVVGLRTDILNLASQRAIERLGAKRDGVIRHQKLRRDGTVRDTVMYSILRVEWPAVKSNLEAKLAASRLPTKY
jgi:RimJ/RimL family protein N-acetyltransferase